MSKRTDTKVALREDMPPITLGDLKAELEKRGPVVPDNGNKQPLVAKPPATGKLFKLPGIIIPGDPKAMIAARKEEADGIKKILEGISGEMRAAVQYLRDARVDQATAEACAEDIKHVEGQVQTYLDNEDLKVRAKSRREFALAMVRTCPASRYMLAELVRGSSTETTTLPGLVDLGLLVQIEDEDENRPPLWAKLPILKADDIVARDGGKHVKLTPIFATFKVDDIEIGKDLTVALRDAAKRVSEQGRQFFAGKREALNEAKRALVDAGAKEITAEELRGKEYGVIEITTPDRAVTLREGSERTYPGGIALYESGPKGVRVVSAIGRFERRMMQIAERSDRFMPVAMLSSRQFNPGRDMRPEERADCTILHQTLYHGLVAMDESERQNAERAQVHAQQIAERAEADKKANEKFAEDREGYASKGTIGFVESFMDEATGKVFVDFTEVDVRTMGTWTVVKKERGQVVEEKKYDHIYVLLERNVDGDIRAEFPERLAPLFGSELKEFKNPGGEYRNLGYPWGPFLRMCWANAAYRRRQAEKRAAATAHQGHAGEPAQTDEVPVIS